MATLKFVGFFLLALILGLLSSLWNGLAINVVWNIWAPHIGTWFPAISYIGAVGMGAVMGAFTWALARFDKEGKTNSEIVAESLTKIIIGPPAVMLGSWLLHTILT